MAAIGGFRSDLSITRKTDEYLTTCFFVMISIGFNLLIVTPRHRCVIMHEVDVSKDRFRFDTTLRNKG